MGLSLLRDTRLYVSTVESSFDDTNTWEILIGAEVSYTQGTATSDITVNEAGATPTRGTERFNDMLEPVDWSFTSYIRPYKETTLAVHYVADAIMWHALVTDSAVDFDNTGGTSPAYGDSSAGAGSFHVNLTERNVHELTNLNLYFITEDKTFHVKGAQVNTAEVTIGIDEIAEVAWSGQGTELVGELDGVSPDFDNVTPAEYDAEFIKNKLTVMEITADYLDQGAKQYDINITGGSISIGNNITYLTPSTLSRVDKPIGSFTGALDVDGSFTAYLADDGSGTGSWGLWQDMLSQNSLSATQHEALLVMYIGGKTAPSATFTFPQAMLAVPDVESADIIATSVEFKALPTELESTDEMTLEIFNSQ